MVTAPVVVEEELQDERCERCGITCICLTPEQVAAYVTGGDNARWLRRGGS